MDWRHELWARVRASRGRDATEREMAEEIAFHLEESQREYERRGYSPGEARRQAKISFGSVERFAEEARFEERARWLEQLGEDVRYALRTFGRQKLWALSIVLVLALGVGANTAMFTLVDAVLFRKPDAVRPDELVRIYSGRSEDEFGTSYPLFLDYRSASGLSGVAATSTGTSLNVVVGTQPAERVSGTLVTGNYFELLGTRPAVGRLLSPQDDRAKGAHPVVVLSHDYWRRVFAGERSAIGQTLRINGTVFTVIGVAPRGFRGETFDHDTQIWLSTAMTEVAQPGWQALQPLERRGFAWLDVVARLRPGATVAQVEAQLNGIARAGENNRNRPVQVSVRRASDVTITIDRVAAAARLSWILLGVVGLVLLLACADVAALLIARAEQRRRELAVRLALGATRGRLIRQLLAESFMLAVAGAVGGIAVAMLLRRAAAGFVPNEFLIPINSAAEMFDARTLALTAGTAIGCALLFGSAPAFAATRMALPGVLRGQTAGVGIFGRVRFTLRDALVVVQLALCLLFLTGAALLGRSLRKAAALDLGFARTGVVLGNIDLARSGYNRARGEVFYRQLLENLRAQPGVQSAALAFHPGLMNASLGNSADFEGHVYANPDEMPVVDINIVTPGYLRTVGTQLLAGRDLTDADIESSRPVVLVSKALADKYWPGQNPLGKHIGAISTPAAEVVGVVANAKYRTLREEPHPLILMPLWQMHMSSVGVVLRTTLPAGAAQALMRETVAQLDPNVPVYRSGTVEERLGAALAQERLLGALLSVFGGLALLLSAAGLFALISFVVRSRTREWGIRIAIGARPGDVTRLVQARGARIALAGIGLGLVGAFVLTRYLRSLLFNVQPTDPLSFGAATALLFAVALVAGYVPARAATRTDAVTSLRTE